MVLTGCDVVCRLGCLAKAALEIDRAAKRAKFCPTDLQADGNGCLRKSNPRSSPVCAHQKFLTVSVIIGSHKVRGCMNNTDEAKGVPESQGVMFLPGVKLAYSAGALRQYTMKKSECCKGIDSNPTNCLHSSGGSA